MTRHFRTGLTGANEGLALRSYGNTRGQVARGTVSRSRRSRNL